MNNSGVSFRKRSDNRMGAPDDFTSTYKSRQEQRNAATLQAGHNKEYRASSFHLNIIHEEGE